MIQNDLLWELESLWGSSVASELVHADIFQGHAIMHQIVQIKEEVK